MNHLAIAARLRALAAGSGQDVTSLATRLGVPETALRQSIHETWPHQTVEVLVAAVHYFGVDPTWLMTGEYSSDTHLRVVAAEAGLRSEDVIRMVSQLSLPRVLELPERA